MVKTLDRNSDIRIIRRYLKLFPVTGLLGARQCGKTFLARQLQAKHYFDLENPQDLARLQEPKLALENLKGLIVIDEIQRLPELFPLLRYLVDRKQPQRYLILGSASKELLRQSSESLAGRIGYHYLSGFNLQEVGVESLKKLWLVGGFPRAFLARSNADAFLWLKNYIGTYLEREIGRAHV